jgi:hypothetical protein
MMPPIEFEWRAHVDSTGGRFKVVPDDLRGEPDDDPALLTELLAGRTVFLPEYTSSKVGTLYTRIRTRYNKILRRRSRQVDGTAGYVVWLEDPPPDPGWDDESEAS